jgi:hypothetical protein
MYAPRSALMVTLQISMRMYVSLGTGENRRVSSENVPTTAIILRFSYTDAFLIIQAR